MLHTTLPAVSQLGVSRQAEVTSRRAAQRSCHTNRSLALSDAKAGSASLPRVDCSRQHAGRSHSQHWRAHSAVAEAEAAPDTLAATEPRPFQLDWPEGFQEHFVLGEPLGRGSFGTVSVATCRKTGKEYAVKVIPKHREGASEQHILQKFSLEAQIMTSLGGRPEAVRLHGLYQDTTHVYMVTELCRGGDLETHLKVNGRMTEKESARVIHDVLNVLAECHRQSICYADVKPANFMLKRLYPEPRLPYDRAWPRPLPQREIEVKVVDFGCSTFVAHGTKLKRRTGTPVYMAPELFMRYYGIECDLWAMGMLLYQLLSGRLPFWGGDSSSASPFNVMVAILHQEINTSGAAWEGVSAEAKDLVHRLLDRDFNTRITAAQALKHPWIAANVEEAEERLVLSNVVKLKPRRSSLEGDRRAALPL